MKKTSLKIIVTTLFLFLALILCVAVDETRAQTRAAYSYGFIDVDIDVLPDSDMEITETINLLYHSGTFYYADRWISMDKVESISNVVVREGDLYYDFNPKVRKWIDERKEKGSAPGGDSYAFVNWFEGNKLWIGWWHPATRGGSRTFTITYTVHGGIRIGDARDQLYWKAIFKDHAVPIGRSTITVHLPEGISNESLAIFSYGVPAERSIKEDNTVQFATDIIPPNEELEIQVLFPHGIVSGAIPAWQIEAERQEAYNADVKPVINLALVFLGVLFVPICGGIWIWRAFRNRGAVSKRGFSAQLVYSPPGDLPPALVGLITRASCGAGELVATIYDLARQGVIEVVEAERKVLFLNTRDVMLIKTKREAQYPFERLVINNLASETGTWLAKQKTRLQGLLREFKIEVEAEAVRR